MKTLLIATRNAHKVGEIRTLLGEQFHYLTLADFPGVPEAVEDAVTFAGNAVKKAHTLLNWFAIAADFSSALADAPLFVLADDSGLEVDCLNGAPGVHSARFAALDTGKPGNSSDAANRAKLLQMLKDVPVEKRTARFRCVIALVEFKPRSEISDPQLFEGTCEGRIALSPRGQNGFGYDPLFVPEGFAQTFAELGDEVKNQLSHRAQALTRLRQKKTF